MAAKKTRKSAPTAKPEHIGATAPGHTVQVCSRCDGSGTDPEMTDCTCDVCGGTGEEEIPADYGRHP